MPGQTSVTTGDLYYRGSREKSKSGHDSYRQMASWGSSPVFVNFRIRLPTGTNVSNRIHFVSLHRIHILCRHIHFASLPPFKHLILHDFIKTTVTTPILNNGRISFTRVLAKATSSTRTTPTVKCSILRLIQPGGRRADTRIPSGQCRTPEYTVVTFVRFLCAVIVFCCRFILQLFFCFCLIPYF